MSLLELKKINYVYHTLAGDVHAVKDASISFDKEKMYAVTGRSGSGKTTLLSMIAGLAKPESGDLFLEGKSFSEFDMNGYRRHRMGMVFQSFYLLPQLTAGENVKMILDLNKYSGDRNKRVSKLFTEVGLTDFHANKRPLQLSGGEQQRVAIARALASDADILLCDEPTGNLDNENSKNIIGLLKKLAHEKGKCVIVVTHSEEIAAECDVEYHMSDGRIVSERK